MTDVISATDLALLIDHTILKPDATQAQVRQFCDEAKAHGFRSVCVNSIHVPLVAEQLRGSTVRVCSVVGFPLGAMPSTVKAIETTEAVAAGAEEIDMVIPVGALKEGLREIVLADIVAVRAACKNQVLKVIIETCLLTDAEKRLACELSVQAGADFVKTSTGFSTSGATIEDVALMRSVVGPSLGVKASGGVRTLEAAHAMIAAGANRIGTSSGIALVTQTAPVAGSY
ncbi:deoxyribose-phosphate aldolase [Lichenicola cladoniae]|uniref:Deoxyribose-phosphate aldolase n=1 Tax=Lichenicola cladoniae TaxID=1484109 RepID=A0A6M8HU73_9PROT|nr:deoxyribose-phosphate aldolase [Lichenicola cladoniae]NPD66222.1 deoxyribose-phosphate aldolase [Acetobacteraceae bacterium]QKE92079.1 deoxyribose-phosphate aldolase [Lichenicola cladoniae]